MNDETYECRKLLTVAQFATKHTAFSEASIRWLIFQARNNGMATAFLKLGRRVYIDEARFFECLDALQAE